MCPSIENDRLQRNFVLDELFILMLSSFLNDPLRREKGISREEPFYDKAFLPHIHLKNSLQKEKT